MTLDHKIALQYFSLMVNKMNCYVIANDKENRDEKEEDLKYQSLKSNYNLWLRNFSYSKC